MITISGKNVPLRISNYLVLALRSFSKADEYRRLFAPQFVEVFSSPGSINFAGDWLERTN